VLLETKPDGSGALASNAQHVLSAAAALAQPIVALVTGCGLESKTAASAATALPGVSQVGL
jgi:hypothetical protein